MAAALVGQMSGLSLASQQKVVRTVCVHSSATTDVATVTLPAHSAERGFRIKLHSGTLTAELPFSADAQPGQASASG